MSAIDVMPAHSAGVAEGSGTRLDPEAFGSAWSQIIMTWLGRVTAVGMSILLVLILVTVHRGRVVQASARGVVNDFSAANKLFVPVNLSTAATARVELEHLTAILTQLSRSASDDVALLTSAAPGLSNALSKVGGDVQLATTLKATAQQLITSAGSFVNVGVAGAAGATQIVALIGQLNALDAALNGDLATIQSRLGLVPTLPP